MSSSTARPVGVTPLAAPLTVDAGSHVLRVKKPGFQTVEQPIDVAGGNEATVAITFVALVPASRLVVSTDAAALVSIDGKPVAQGRFDGRVPSGHHIVEVTEAEKRPYETQVDLTDGDVRTLQVALIDKPRSALWPWLVGGAAVVAGAVVGTYFLIKPHDEVQGPSGTLGTYTIPTP